MPRQEAFCVLSPAGPNCAISGVLVPTSDPFGQTELLCAASICSAVQTGKPWGFTTTPSQPHDQLIGDAGRIPGPASVPFRDQLPENGAGAFLLPPPLLPVCVVEYVVAADADAANTALAVATIAHASAILPFVEAPCIIDSPLL